MKTTPYCVNKRKIYSVHIASLSQCSHKLPRRSCTIDGSGAKIRNTPYNVLYSEQATLASVLGGMN